MHCQGPCSLRPFVSRLYCICRVFNFISNNCRSRTCKSTSLITLTQNCHYCVQSWFPNDEPISQNDDEAQNHKKMKLLILHSIYVQFCLVLSSFVQKCSKYGLVFQLPYSPEQKHMLLFRKSEILLFKVSICNMLQK